MKHQRSGFWLNFCDGAFKAVLFAAFVMAVLVLTACGSDYCSPFDKPSESAQPVDCSASGACD